MDSQWLQTQFRANPEKSKADLAAALALGAPAVSKMLAGTRQIKANEYVAMRRFFGLPVDGENAVRGGGQSSYVIAPLGGVQEKNRGESDAWVMPASLMKAHTRAPSDKLRIFAVQENAMAPDFAPGEQVLVDLSDAKPSPPGVFVVSDGLGHMVRQLEYIPHSRPPAVRISARSGAYEAYTLPLEKAGIVGRVIAKLQWL